jgi:hypothetical protein
VAIGTLCNGLVRLFHLPQLPSLAYDALGVLTFSLTRGSRIGIQLLLGLRGDQAGPKLLLPYTTYTTEVETEVDDVRRFDRKSAKQFGRKMQLRYLFALSPRQDADEIARVTSQEYIVFRFSHFFVLARILLFSIAIATVLAALFGIDYVYRHFV